MSDPVLADVRKRAIGKGVPEPFVEWCLNSYLGSNPGKLPTKGEAFQNCGPGTHLGERLLKSRRGASSARFGEWLKVIRELLQGHAFIVKTGPGKTRRRASGVDVESMDDPTELNPREQAEDDEPWEDAEGRDTEGSS